MRTWGTGSSISSLGHLQGPELQQGPESSLDTNRGLITAAHLCQSVDKVVYLSELVGCVVVGWLVVVVER